MDGLSCSTRSAVRHGRHAVGVDRVDGDRPGRVASGRAGEDSELSTAADAIAPSAVPGEPVMYWLGPQLPAEVTTMTPALAAFVEATADGSSSRRTASRATC